MCDARVALVVLVSGTTWYIWGLRRKEVLHGSLEWGRRDLEGRRWVEAGGRDGRGEDGLRVLHVERRRDVETSHRRPAGQTKKSDQSSQGEQSESLVATCTRIQRQAQAEIVSYLHSRNLV